MEGKQNLYYALGQIAYAVAKADGSIQNEEKQKLHDIVLEHIKLHDTEFDISEIIFHVLQKENLSFQHAYNWGIKELSKYSYYLTDDMKIDFIATVEKIAYAFDSMTIEEESVIEKFRQDLVAI